MLTEPLALAILTASITGAGLILAIYAFIAPISSKMFEKRVELLSKKMKQFDKMKEKIDSESSDKDFKRLKTLASQIKEVRMFPKYLGIGVATVFTFYMLAALFSFGWLLNPTTRGAAEETVPVILFAFSTFAFTLVGFMAIGDTYRTMKAEFEELRQKQEEFEKTRRELTKLKKDFEEAKKRRVTTQARKP